MRIIKSFLDTDKYKLTMGRFVYHMHPNAEVVYEFKCRNKNVDLSPYADLIMNQINQLSELQLTQVEKEYLLKNGYNKEFVDFLSNFKFNPKEEVEITTDPFTLKFKGLWKNTIYYEVPVLAIINEIYFNHIAPLNTISMTEGDKRLMEKIEMVKNFGDPGFKFMDFGTRRRRSAPWQLNVVSTLNQMLPDNFIGTSNIHYAHLLNIKCHGTMAHEFLSAYQRFADIKTFQYKALYDWIYFNKGTLGIALTDIIGFDAFLEEFKWDLARLYDGMRQDSGDPYWWGEKFKKFYENLGIDPKTKVAIFSNALTIPEAIQIYRHFKGDFKMVFGIGTHLTNDFEHKALNIVIKMIYCNGKAVAKLADDSGKGMCPDPEWVNYIKIQRNLTHVK